MFEGSATNRVMQVVAGICLAILTALCLFVGILGLYAIIFQQNRESITLILTIIFLPIGVIGLLMSKRLILAKGSRKGAGILSPNEYRLLGLFFIILSVLMLLYGIFNSSRLLTAFCREFARKTECGLYVHGGFTMAFVFSPILLLIPHQRDLLSVRQRAVSHEKQLIIPSRHMDGCKYVKGALQVKNKTSLVYL